MMAGPNDETRERLAKAARIAPEIRLRTVEHRKVYVTKSKADDPKWVPEREATLLEVRDGITRNAEVASSIVLEADMCVNYAQCGKRVSARFFKKWQESGKTNELAVCAACRKKPPVPCRTCGRPVIGNRARVARSTGKNAYCDRHGNKRLENCACRKCGLQVSAANAHYARERGVLPIHRVCKRAEREWQQEQRAGRVKAAPRPVVVCAVCGARANRSSSSAALKTGEPRGRCDEHKRPRGRPKKTQAPKGGDP